MPEDDVALRDAPERFFDPALWNEYISLPFSRENLLEGLGQRPNPNDDFLIREAKRHVLVLALPTIARRLELKRTMVEEFRERLATGKLVATGFYSFAMERVTIAAERWRDLWPDFINDKAASDTMVFTGVRVSEPAAAADAPSPSLSDASAASTKPSLSVMQRCLDWMRQRAQEGESRKKVLQKEGKELLGNELTTRIFDSAYKEIFSKPRGRPPKKPR
jgi:hypothetical protein